MTDYKYKIGTLHYNASNIPGAAETRVSIENDANRYLYNPLKRTWGSYHDFAGTPELPAGQLEALEAELHEKHEVRTEWYRQHKRRSQHIHTVTEDQSKILEVRIIYAGSCQVDGDEPQPPRCGTLQKSGDNDWWVTGVAEHTATTTQSIERRVIGDTVSAGALEQARQALSAELKQLHFRNHEPADAQYTFKQPVQNPAGFDLNQRVAAVYQFAGFIHKTYRNHPDFTQGKPHWQFIQQGGALSAFESDVSAEDVQQQLIDYTPTHA
jgi:hypothetical protein